jgi:hypothetical protein
MSRRWALLVRCVLGGALAAGCSATRAAPASTAPAPPADTSSLSSAGASDLVPQPALARSGRFEFPDDRDLRSHTLLSIADHVDLNGVPIHVWFAEDRGALVGVRVVGHGDEEACSRASQAIALALLDPAVTGFLTYGVADLAPSGDRDAFDRVARELESTLTGIARASNFVVVHRGASPRDGELAQAVALDAARHLAAVGSVDGPAAFVPVRVVRGRTLEPLEIIVTDAELGLVGSLGERLTAAPNQAPWLALIETLTDQINGLGRWIAWVESGATIDPRVGAYRLGHARLPTSAAAAARVLHASIRDFEIVRRAMEAIMAYGHVAEAMPGTDQILVPSADIREMLDEVSAQVAHNRKCLATIEQGGGCSSAHTIELHPPDADLQSFIAGVNQRASSVSRSELVARRAELQAQLRDVRAELASFTHRSASMRTLGRVAMVDGLLRGWPVSAPSAQDETALDEIIAQNVPRTWNRVLDELAASGIDLATADGVVGGHLVSPSIFYRVQPLAAGRYKITPTYAVHGQFVERWSTDGRAVLLQQPRDGGTP